MWAVSCNYSVLFAERGYERTKVYAITAKHCLRDKDEYQYIRWIKYSIYEYKLLDCEKINTSAELDVGIIVCYTSLDEKLFPTLLPNIQEEYSNYTDIVYVKLLRSDSISFHVDAPEEANCPWTQICKDFYSKLPDEIIQANGKLMEPFNANDTYFFQTLML
jgi:hypothetical protein